MPMTVVCGACGYILYYDNEESIGPVDVIRRYSTNGRCPRCRTRLSPEIPRKLIVEPAKTMKSRKAIALRYWYLTKHRTLTAQKTKAKLKRPPPP
ncbi:MAG: hypothetical protein QW128_01570 [Thermoprotei archaeon]